MAFTTKFGKRTFSRTKTSYSFRQPGNALTNKIVGTYSNGTYGYTRTTEHQTPGWKQRIRYGLNSTTLLVGSMARLRYVPGYAFRRVQGTFDVPPVCSDYEVKGCLCPLPSNPTYDGGATIALSDNAAKTQFIKRARERMSAFSAGTFLGELGEAIRLIKRPGSALRQRIDQYARDAKRNFRRSRGPPHTRERTLRDTWLEHQFGMAPLVSDVSSALKLTYKLLTHDDPSSWVSTSWIKKEALCSDIAGSSASDVTASLNWTYREMRKFRAYTKYYGRILIDVDERGHALASTQFGFSWHDFVPTIYNLIPYSFLVDYFTNLGDVIEAISFPTARIRWVVKSVRQERESTTYDVQ